MTLPDLRPLLDFATEAAYTAGRLTLGYYQNAPTTERKSDHSPVTIADRAAEQHLRDRIQRFWPDHAIHGEEFGQHHADSPFKWVIDPIDGTQSFIHGVPFYGTLLALLHNDQPIVGVIYHPALEEMVAAAQGLGCYFNGRLAHVSATTTLADAALLTSTLNYFDKLGKAAAWQRLVNATEIQRTWGDCYGYTLVATGRADIMVDPIMEIWDAAPLQVIIEEAGGRFTDWQGVPTIHHRECIATNGHLHTAVLAEVTAA